MTPRGTPPNDVSGLDHGVWAPKQHIRSMRSMDFNLKVRCKHIMRWMILMSLLGMNNVISSVGLRLNGIGYLKGRLGCECDWESMTQSVVSRQKLNLFLNSCILVRVESTSLNLLFLTAHIDVSWRYRYFYWPRFGIPHLLVVTRVLVLCFLHVLSLSSWFEAAVSGAKHWQSGVPQNGHWLSKFDTPILGR